MNRVIIDRVKDLYDFIVDQSTIVKNKLNIFDNKMYDRSYVIYTYSGITISIFKVRNDDLITWIFGRDKFHYYYNISCNGFEVTDLTQRIKLFNFLEKNLHDAVSKLETEKNNIIERIISEFDQGLI